MAVAISEPDAGSAATDMTTTAPSATATTTSSTAPSAGSPTAATPTTTCVYARLSDEPGAKGIGALVVEADTPGRQLRRPEKLMGFRGIPSADVIFDDVRVPEENLVVAAGGFRKLFSAFSIERLGNATMSLAHRPGRARPHRSPTCRSASSSASRSSSSRPCR